MRNVRTDDTEVIARALAGDWRAFTKLMERHRHAVSGIAYAFLATWDDVEDATQEVFIQVYLKLGELRAPESFSAWLRRITMNVCADMLRRKGPTVVPLGEAGEHVLLPQRHPDEQFDTGVAVREALRRLPEKLRLTTILRYVDGYSHAEVAGLLGIPVNTVRSRLQNAKRQLAKEMVTMEKVKDELGIVTAELERHWSLPSAVLRQGRITHVPLDINTAAWTRDGGAVACLDADLAAGIRGVITGCASDDYVGCLSKLQRVLRETVPAAKCNLYEAVALEQIRKDHLRLPAVACDLRVHLICSGSATAAKNDLRDVVETLAAKDLDPEDFPPRAEHVLAIRMGTLLPGGIRAAAWRMSDKEATPPVATRVRREDLVAYAAHVPNFKVGDQWYSAVGEFVHRDYRHTHRNKELLETVLCALLDHLASEGGVALEVCDVRDVDLLEIYHSVGFVDSIWTFQWEVSGEAAGSG